MKTQKVRFYVEIEVPVLANTSRLNGMIQDISEFVASRSAEHFSMEQREMACGWQRKGNWGSSAMSELGRLFGLISKKYLITHFLSVNRFWTIIRS